MFALIIAIISIALVVAVTAVGGFHGGAALSEADAQAQAARVKNEEQQILAAVDAFNADRGHWPTDVQELVSTGYLLTAPQGIVELQASSPALTMISAAWAQSVSQAGWRTPVAGQPIFTTSTSVPELVCQKYNLVSRGDDGILKKPFTGLPAQCYGTDKAYQVVVTRTGAVPLASVFGPDQTETGNIPAKDTGDVWWEIAPRGELKAPVDTSKVPFADLRLHPSTVETFGQVQVGQTAVSAARTLINGGNIPATGVTLQAPEGFSLASNSCGPTLAVNASCSFALQFAPTEAKAYAGALSVSSANAGATSFEVAGTARAASATLSSLNFGNLAAGATADRTATLRNTGVGPISLAAASVAGNGFALASGNTCGATLAAGESCSIPVRLTAAGTTNHTGTLSVPSIEVGSITASLAGQAQQAVASVSPTSRAFGDVQVGESVVSDAHTVRNLGNIPATGLSIQPPAGFSLADNSCGTSLAAGASCTFSVSYAPVAAEPASGHVQVSTANAGNHLVSLSGAGRNQAATLLPVSFGNVAAGTAVEQAATLTNTGVGPLSVVRPSAASVTGQGFAFVNTNCTTSLPVGGSCTTTVRYTATGVAAAAGLLTVNTGAGIQTAALQGQSQTAVLAVTPTTRAFGQVQVGQTVTSNAHAVTNNGNIPATGFTVVPPAGFTLEGNTCTQQSLPAGQSCSFSLKFAPLAAKAYDGAVQVNSTNGGSAPVSLTAQAMDAAASVNNLSFGSRASGSQTDLVATLANTGVGPLSVSAPTAASVTGAGFSLVSTSCPTTLAVGENCAITVRYLASGVAAAAGTLTVTTGAGVKTSALSGQSEQASLSVTPTARAFGNVQAGQSATSAAHTLTNSGNIAASGVTFSPPGGFTLGSNTCASTLAAGASCTFTVTFAPGSAQPYISSLNITSSNAGSAPVSVTGTGVAQSATLDHLAFGSRAAGASADLSATLTNNGIGPLSVVAPTAGSVAGSGFNLVATNCGSSLSTGASCTTTVRYTPSGTSAANGTLTIATGAGSMVSNLTGQSQQATLSVNPTSRAFGNVQVGQSLVSAVHTLTNTGNIAASGVSLAAPGGYSVSNNNCAASLAAGASCTFTATFSPASAQPYNANLGITSSNAGSAPVALTGTGVAPSATLNNVTFGSRAAGSVTDLAATLTNTGIAAISVSVPSAGSVTGAGFALLSTNCGSSLGAGASCVSTVRYTASGVAAASGTLTISTGAGVKTAALSGQSQQADLVVTGATSYAFGAVQTDEYRSSSSWTVTNPGNLAVTDLSLSAPAGYTVRTSTCGASLASGQACSFTVDFQPTAATSYSGSVTIRSAQYGLTRTIGLSGTGAAPSASIGNAAFGERTLGVTAYMDVYLTNTGVGGLDVTAPGYYDVGGNYAFAVSSTTCGGRLASGQSCAITLVYYPSRAGTETGVLTVNTSAGAKQSNISGVVYGSTATVTSSTYLSFDANHNLSNAGRPSQSITIRNDGNRNMTLTTAAKTGVFNRTGNTCTNIAPGNSCVMSFDMDTNWYFSGGTWQYGYLYLEGASATVTVYAEGVTRSDDVQWQQTSVAFGGGARNTATSVQVSVYNAGNKQWVPGQLINAPANVTSNVLSACPVVPAFSFCTVTFTYTRTAAGTWSSPQVFVSPATYGNSMTFTGSSS